jgi:hypothetical protein
MGEEPRCARTRAATTSEDKGGPQMLQGRKEGYEIVGKRRESIDNGRREGCEVGGLVVKWPAQQTFRMRVAGPSNRPFGVGADGLAKGTSCIHSATTQTPVGNPR